MNLTFRSITLITALFSGVSGGVLFAFSTFIMPALRNLPADQGVAAMNAINVAAPRSLFMLPLFGGAVGAIVVGVWALTHSAGRGWLIAGAIGALATVIITMGFHVPRNDALIAMDPNAAATVALWPGWAAAWTAANSIRTATALLGAVFLLFGVRAATR